jgi:hypothetical protein
MIQQMLEEEQWQDRLTAIDLRALSPLKWQHVNPHGTFTTRYCLPFKLPAVRQDDTLSFLLTTFARFKASNQAQPTNNVPHSCPIQDESLMTVPVTRGDENGGAPE